MPSMYEIYRNYSEQYDELINCEDYQNNLQKFLNPFFGKNQTVLELGAGTGRLTEMYIDKVKHAVCCDKYEHMLDRHKKKLKTYNKKINYVCVDTKDIGTLDLKCDLIIEGWAVGHSIIDEFKTADDFLKHLFNDLYKKLNKNGKIIFIETMGSNVEKPKPPLKELTFLYENLEQVYNMKKTVIRTDYKFPNIQEAKRIMKFFFGDQIQKEIQSNIIKEYTGIWTAPVS